MQRLKKNGVVFLAFIIFIATFYYGIEDNQEVSAASYYYYDLYSLTENFTNIVENSTTYYSGYPGYDDLYYRSGPNSYSVDKITGAVTLSGWHDGPRDYNMYGDWSIYTKISDTRLSVVSHTSRYCDSYGCYSSFYRTYDLVISKKGNLIQSNVVRDSSFPVEGVKDGYWWVRKQPLPNRTPYLAVTEQDRTHYWNKYSVQNKTYIEGQWEYRGIYEPYYGGINNLTLRASYGFDPQHGFYAEGATVLVPSERYEGYEVYPTGVRRYVGRGYQTWDEYYKIAILDETPRRGAFLEKIVGKSNQYPANGVKDGYWYVYEGPTSSSGEFTADNQVLADLEGYNIFEIKGTVQDLDNDQLTVTATMDGKTKTVRVSNTESVQTFKLTFDVIADKIQHGKHGVTITASDGRGGVATSYLNVTVQAFVEDQKYVLVDDLLIYATTYSDYENDTMLKDQFKYEHDQVFFENNIGELPDSGLWRDTSYNRLSLPGHYKIYYRAMDNPNSDPNFSEFQKWSPSTPALNLYVHRKPVPEFSFTTNKATRTYAVTNLAYDLDKYSTDIGNGPGIQLQKFEWRLKGQTAWNPGLPPSPLSLAVYEIKNSVVDFQNREESLVKEMNATGLNVPPVPNFQINYLVPSGKDVKPKNLSWDPNGDNIVGYKWQMKKKEEPDSAFKDIPNTTNVQEPSLTFTTLGKYVLRLKVMDEHGLWSAPPQEWHTEEIEVYLGNNDPVAGFKVTPTQYVGEAIEITSTAEDEDDDILTYEYTVKPPNKMPFSVSSGESYTDRIGNVITIGPTGEFTIPTYDQSDVGTWTITQKVTDPMGASDVAGPKQAVVLDLTIDGYVTHTEAWQRIHEEKGNLPDEFYSGEKFILHADVLPRPIRSVTVNATGRLESNSDFSGSVPLAKLTDIRYNGEYFEARFAEIGTQIRTDTDVIFTFTVVYENGTEDGYSVTDTVTVRIIGSALGLLELHQAF